MFMSTPQIREAVRRRVAAVLEALAAQGINEAAVHTAFVAEFRSRAEADAAWVRLKSLDNPTAAELTPYARALQVNTTWLMTGDVRFINAELMSGTCLCWLLPARQHFVYLGAVEPGSTHEYNPGCLVHGPALEQEYLSHVALLGLDLTAEFAGAASTPTTSEAAF